MSKNYYFGVTVFLIVALTLIANLCSDVKTIVSVGFSFTICVIGIALNELAIRRESAENFQDTMRDRLESIDFELQILRDCKFDALTERSKHLSESIAHLGVLAGMMGHAKEQKKTPENDPHTEEPKE